MEELSILELASKGGWIMGVLALMSIVAVYIFVERFLAIRNAGKDDKLFMDRIRDYIKNNDVKSAINFCRVTNTAAARIIERGISRMGKPAAEIQAAIENTGDLEIAIMERRLPVLATIAGGAPMIGFLGTVIGMVMSFDQIEIAGDISQTIVGSGMKVALITTIFGIITALILQLFYNYLLSKIDHLTAQMEESAITLMDTLKEVKGE